MNPLPFLLVCCAWPASSPRTPWFLLSVNHSCQFAEFADSSCKCYSLTRYKRHASNRNQDAAMNFLTHRRTFIKTMALASASVPFGLRHTSGAPAEQSPAPQVQNPLFGVHFSPASGKLSAWRKGAAFLSDAVARAVTATGVRSTIEGVPVLWRAAGALFRAA